MDLNHHFLVAMPLLDDEHFRRSVVYILQHGDDGAFGVVVNDALDIPLGEALSQLDILTTDPSVAASSLLRGGPVNPEHGLVLHPPGPIFESTRDFSGGVSLSSSRDVLEALAAGQEPQTHLVILGHAGWSPGQLENEVAANAWLTCEAESSVLFDTPWEERRAATGRLMGVNLDQISAQTGHA